MPDILHTYDTWQSQGLCLCRSHLLFFFCAFFLKYFISNYNSNNGIKLLMGYKREGLSLVDWNEFGILFHKIED